MRVVGGRLRGRALATPDDQLIRPTSDRVREAVFNILAHGVAGFDIAGKRVLDLFAGTGALGIEALSRGATFVLFVEEAAEARGLVRRNVEALGLTGQTRIYRRDATSLGPALPRERFDVVFADPPYGKHLGEAALAAAALGGWLEPEALAVLEERADVAVMWPEGFTPLDERHWGDTAVHFARWSPVSQVPAA
ncbi:MAG: 16S rRNA (guanine(966)-N(2))-methyltransferase RsmD [Proteobacteria bacterium]|nr:16S rRNA (guanine(966)-N(2))-methyltransferase RsmD [Pseudomonadota bacterium]